MTTNVVWWHFSDIHWDLRTCFERRTFLDALHGDLRNRKEEFGPPDFVVLTGDLAYSGEPAQYAALEQEFLTPLRTLTGTDCPFFPVPGNHDARRSASRMINPELITSLTSAGVVDEFLDSDECAQLVARPFAAYESFAARVVPEVTREPLSWSTQLQVKGVPVRLVGLNSSWATTYHRNAAGQVEDERRLLMGQKQLQALMQPCDDDTLRLVLAHHPLKWLSGFCENQIRQLLQRHADFVLFGHTHALHDLSQTLGAAGTTAFLPTPALYDRAPTDTVEYARGYNIVRLDPETRQAQVHYFKYTAAYAAQFLAFDELYSSPGQRFFSVDLSGRRRRESTPLRKRVQVRSLAQALLTYPKLAVIDDYLESALNLAALERHTAAHFEALIAELSTESDLADPDLSHLFWEAVLLCRALIYCDVIQQNGNRLARYSGHRSAEALCTVLQALQQQHAETLQLAVDDYRRLLALCFDSCSFVSTALGSICEPYRRMFSMPWALSRLLVYLDHPALIPHALRSEGSIADLCTSLKNEPFALMGYRFDPQRTLLTVDLRIQDKSGFLAVALLKHYFGRVLQQIRVLWRQTQRILPPLTLSLEFPHWLNKQVYDYELSVEPAPIFRLVMGDALYGEAAHVWLRELTQNGRDALAVRSALDDSGYVPRLDIIWRDPTTCIIRDNGIGMSQQQILLYLTRLGRSIWNSEEFNERRQLSRDTALQVIGKFGIGFAAVFQHAERVVVRTRFFREIGESGWIVEFNSIDRPFLLEAANVPVGTEVEVQLRSDLDEALTPGVFIELARRFFLYVDDHIHIQPDPELPRRLTDTVLLEDEDLAKFTVRDYTTRQHVAAYSFNLRCIFGFDFQAAHKRDYPPNSRLIVTNAGVFVFEQGSLELDARRGHLDTTEIALLSDRFDTDIDHFWIVLDFDKGASPLQPSRQAIDVDERFKYGLLELIHRIFNDALRSVVQEILNRDWDPVRRQNALLNTLLYSTGWLTGHSQERRFQPDSIEATIVELYSKHCTLRVQSATGEPEHVSLQSLLSGPAGIFVTEEVAKSPLFPLFAKAWGEQRWVVVRDDREYALFEAASSPIAWRGIDNIRQLYMQRINVFSEIVDSPLAGLIRGDYAVISDPIFNTEAFMMLPANIPRAWPSGEAANFVRKEVLHEQPPRVLINPQHTLYQRLANFAVKCVTDNLKQELREFRMLLEALCDGVIENRRFPVARQRWQTLQRELIPYIGNLPETTHRQLIVRL